MAFHTKKDFSTLCGIRSGDLYNYMKRGKVVFENNLVDDKNPLNRAFLDKYVAKNPVSSPKKAVVKKAKEDRMQEYSDNSEVSLTNMLKEKTVLESLQKRNQITLQQIEIQKKRGELVPTHAVNSLFVQHSESIKTAYVEASDNLVVILSQKHNLNAVDIADIRSKFFGIVNKAVDTAIDASVRNMKAIVKEYSVKKGVNSEN